jgi:hypothetical protein
MQRKLSLDATVTNPLTNAPEREADCSDRLDF